MDAKIDIVVQEYKNMINEHPGSTGKIEIRSFGTEFRNQMSIHKNTSGSLTAWIILMFPHKRAGNCPMLVLQGGIVDDYCMGYFEKVWDLHANDVLYRS